MPLIVGAGPVGLAAALFLVRDGVIPRVIESTGEPSPYSKALAINPRTLEILDPTGLTEKILALGTPIHGARFWHAGAVVGELVFRSLPHKYPYLVALSQAVTTRLLEASLNENGVHVERNVALAHCRNRSRGVEAQLRLPSGESRSVTTPWLLAADGVHSTARGDLGIPFSGTRFEKEWHLVDAPLATSLAEDFAHVVFLDEGGFIFLIRVVDGREPSRHGDPVWRMMGNIPNLLDRDVVGRVTGPPVWASRFHVAHRTADRMQAGGIFLAGDAAHVHSPIGARGMNLGIEDAWVFSRLRAGGDLSQYGELRTSVDRRVVRRIELISRLARGESVVSRLLRSTALPLMTRTPLTRNRLMEMVTGLDHPLPERFPA